MLIALAGPLALAAILVPFRASFRNTDAALALLLVVVAVAANGNRLAGYLSALSVAAWFDFFFTPPYERFTITRRPDVETTVLLLLIGMAVTELAVWGRRQQAAAAQRAGYLDGITAAARSRYILYFTNEMYRDFYEWPDEAGKGGAGCSRDSLTGRVGWWSWLRRKPGS